MVQQSENDASRMTRRALLIAGGAQLLRLHSSFAMELRRSRPKEAFLRKSRSWSSPTQDSEKRLSTLPPVVKTECGVAAAAIARLIRSDSSCRHGAPLLR